MLVSLVQTTLLVFCATVDLGRVVVVFMVSVSYITVAER